MARNQLLKTRIRKIQVFFHKYENWQRVVNYLCGHKLMSPGNGTFPHSEVLKFKQQKAAVGRKKVDAFHGIQKQGSFRVSIASLLLREFSTQFTAKIIFWCFTKCKTTKFCYRIQTKSDSYFYMVVFSTWKRIRRLITSNRL